ncbi:Inner-membrane translocator ABC transporter [Roseovarius sp. EC-HK134]|uniref:branched-chain amino acid ABC transporter ATP-binding protein/permease n=1 Tax=Roseovarius TaxID=74030 RepID=UPI00015566C6|nr:MULTISPECIES: branched-chain amino acid ABC transporter ATP-binding protein/permease [unclassified Roseovarius]AWZ19769.1 ABC transporter ATP-binding/permease protein [Roseovarius sp. AK1035]EDM30248.1 inner-membrane translocator ABC transporter [Roseovarius sp. TM1035]VVT09950.1 Inner-membrane translocator ABC transporter [Roseovarius sp. EC-HK134]VVT10174.1 Inner-membrane translocator ABC transporter [Roseovarius sp. EC-SD190]|tara:strand:+ start:12298 stop:14838 length:2541 start_codon:yes stop_codon:yes gene_type:complete
MAEQEYVSARLRLTRLLAHPGTSILGIVALTAITIMLALNANGYLVFILALFALNVVVGVGLNILLGLSGQISFGHVGFFAIGAYTTAIMVIAGFDYWLAFIVSGIISSFAGMLLAMPALRVAGPYLAMMTIAFAFIVEHAAIELRDLTGGHNGLMGFRSPEFAGRIFFETEVAIAAVLLAGVSLLLFLQLSRGRWGMAMRAVASSDVAAQSIGLNPFAIKTTAFVLSALLAGLAGALFTPLQLFISPGSFPFFQSILFLLAVIVGGTGRLLGPVIGSLIVVLLPEVLSGLAEYRLLIFGGIMMGVLLLAPKGIIGGLMGYLSAEDPTTAKASGKALGDFLSGLNENTGGLKVTDLGIKFGGVQAAKDVSFTAPAGRITSVIGPNGAGKTTVLNMISGFYKPDSGRIEMSEDIAGRPAWRTARAGIARTYQTTQLFEDLSVRENILIALGTGHLGWLLGRPPRDAQIALADDLLAFVGYKGPVARRSGDLPHVDKRLVEIARALATKPSVLLLDEPAAGLMHSDKEALSLLIRKIAEAGVAVVLVEHDMSMIMRISDEIIVLDAGVPIKTGAPSDVQNDPAVRRAYLGDSAYQGRERSTPWIRGGKKDVLSTRSLTAGYGAAAALDSLDMDVQPGEMVAVLGANGAGKSTMMRSLAGLHRPVSGAILLDMVPIEERPAHQIARAGLSLVPEGRQVFPLMSVRDNILMGAYNRTDLDAEAEIDRLLQRFPRLRDRIDAPAGVLSGGEQQMLAIARGLIANPRILLLDEPSLGLAPSIIAELYDVLADLRDEGVTVLLVDQMATLALAIADRAYVLESGQVVKSGTSVDLQKDASIEQAYLGAEVAAQ